jgi:hypothetical protein
MLLLSACTPTDASGSATNSNPDPSQKPNYWATRPDAQGHYYAGNPNAKLVIEEFSDFQ